LLLLVGRVSVLAQDARFTSTLSCARTFSRTVQSVFTLARTVLTSSRAIRRNVSSPSTFTALSLVSSAS
jgi:hypothetical protein